MSYYMTFPQALDALMKKHSLTVRTIGAQLGTRAELRRALNDELSEAKRAVLYQKICDCGPFSSEECHELGVALEVSRVGVGRYAGLQAIDRLMLGREDADAETCFLSNGVMLQARLETLLDAEEISILCLNSAYLSVYTALQPLFADPDRKIRMRHYIQPDIHGLNAAELVSSIRPVLFDSRYSAFLMASWPVTGQLPSVNGNLLAIYARFSRHVEEQFYVIGSPSLAYELPNASSVGLHGFLSRIIDELPVKPATIKAFDQTAADYAGFMMSCLGRELNRSVLIYGDDISISQAPTAIVVAALRDNAAFPRNVLDQLITRVGPLHEQRYLNVFTKKKPTFQTLSIAGMKRFMEQGVSRDYFMGLRPYLPKERLTILKTLLHNARINPSYSPALFKDADFRCRYLSVCYDRLGVAISEYDTDYNITGGYDHVMLTYPEFTSQFSEYMHNTVFRERCYSRDESLQQLHEMCRVYEREFAQDPL